MAGLTNTYNVCPGCGAGVGARATTCALCDSPLPRGGRRSASQRTPQTPDALDPAQQRVWRELAEALSPGIRVVGYLAEGGMGSVFLGYDVSLKREVAIKVLTPALAEDAVARARFKREAEAAGGVSHPNVVAVHQVGELPASGAPFFVMQFVDGPTLQHAVQNHLVLPESRVRRILGDVASGLAVAHRRGVVHRDIKPTNVVLDAETGRALVLDFGIAAALDARRSSGSMRLTTEGMYVGTPMYMSPEQAGSGEVTDRSDIYSLAVVAFELLTGRPPFTGANALVLMAAHLKEPAPRVDTLRTDVSSELAILLDRCLAKDPLQRPTSQALVDFFDPAAASIIAWPPPGLERARGTGARFLGALALLGAAIIAFFALVHSSTLAPSVQGVAADRSLLSVTAVLVFMFAGLTIGTGARVAHAAARGRRAGYPWAVVVDVLGDRWRDTDGLLNGHGIHALGDSVTRGRFIRLRRLTALLFAAGSVLAVLAPLFWLAGAMVRTDAAGQLVTRAEVMLLTMPPLLLVAAALACTIPEARWRRRNSTSTPASPATRAVREELVRSWLQVARRGAIAPSRRPVRAALLGAIVLASAAITVTVALALFAVLMSTTLRLQSEPAATAWATRVVPEPSAVRRRDGMGASIAGLPALFADPASPVAQRMTADRTLSPAVRAELPMQVAAGLCMNARELLFGPSRNRRDLARAAPRLAGMESDPRTVRSAALAEAWLEDPASLAAPAGAALAGSPASSSPNVTQALGMLGLASLRARVDYCARLVRA